MIEGKVVEVSDAGDLITDILMPKWQSIPRESSTKVIVDDEHETFGLFGTDHEQPAMTLIAIVEDSKPLRLSLVEDSATMMLGVKSGAPVKITW